MSTFYFTSSIGVENPITMCENMTSPLVVNATLESLDCVPQTPPTSLLTKVVYAVWVWAIFFTFPGTYSTQPAVTTQTFGHKYGGFIYAFLFSGDIINNALTGFVSKLIKATWGWLGLFLIISGAG